jgi:hypothetical protein
MTARGERTGREACATGLSRRELLAYASIFGWFPWFKPKHVDVAGARFRIIRYGHYSYGHYTRRYLVIHGNEETARQVLTAHMRAHPGKALIIQGKTRDVPVAGGVIDPNRMFSREGAQANLKHLNPKWSEAQVNAALAALDHGREKLLKELTPPSDGLLVSLHNNSPNYSVAIEQPISDAASIRDPDNLHAFFLCTDPDDFRILSTSPYNVVYQHNAPKQDDGSLSRLSTMRGFRYVNLEVALGQAGRQKEMLDWLEWNVP